MKRLTEKQLREWVEKERKKAKKKGRIMEFDCGCGNLKIIEIMRKKSKPYQRDKMILYYRNGKLTMLEFELRENFEIMDDFVVGKFFDKYIYTKNFRIIRDFTTNLPLIIVIDVFFDNKWAEIFEINENEFKSLCLVEKL